ncbi:MAG TPA: acyl-CoA dehydrogenase family protein [Pseudonocardiaceae bacterium]
MTKSVEDFRIRVREALQKAEAKSALASALSREDGIDGDVRPLYRILGDAGLLATTWPRTWGGRDADFVESVVLIEELTRNRVPVSLHYITVHIVGSLLLECGTRAQQQRHLPPMALGERYACILFTEPDTGSDLGSVSCAARRAGDGWVVTGRKLYNLKTSYADFALTLVRTDEHASRYLGLTLMLIPLDAPGVSLRRIPTMIGEHFHDVELDNVMVGPEAVLGAEGEGWSLVSTLFAAERNGLDYYARGLHWLESARELLCRLPPEQAALSAAGLARLWARLDASRLLSLHALQRLAQGRADVASASLAKWHCSESAQRIAWWAGETLDLTVLDPAAEVLAAAYREAASLTIAGGASEVLLETVVGAKLLEGSSAGAVSA